MVWRRRLARSAAVGKGSPPFMLYITTTKRSQYVLTRKMRAGPNFLWRSGDRLSGGLTAETGPSSRAPSSADFSSTYRTEGPAGFLMANLLSESQKRACFRISFSHCRISRAPPASAGFLAIKALSTRNTRQSAKCRDLKGMHGSNIGIDRVSILDAAEAGRDAKIGAAMQCLTHGAADIH